MLAISSNLYAQPITQPMSIRTSPGNGRFTVTISRSIKKIPNNITNKTHELVTKEGSMTEVKTNSHSETQSASINATPQPKPKHKPKQLPSSPTKKRKFNDPTNIQQIKNRFQEIRYQRDLELRLRLGLM